jgi:transcriptional regulator with XRE-family HTH domain
MRELHRTWGDNIRADRKTVGLSRTELELIVGVAEITFARWETGSCGPRDAHWVALAEAFEVPVATLFCYVLAV